MKIDHVPYTEETLHLSAEWLRTADIQALTDTPAFSLEDQLRWFAGLTAGGDYKAWTVRAENRPIGAFGIKNITPGQGEYWGYIGEKEWWGKGVGNYLMIAATAEAKALNIRALVLRVNNKNIRAINLYISNGYRIYELERDTHYLMRLDLST